jgi:hypothetical protein
MDFRLLLIAFFTNFGLIRDLGIDFRYFNSYNLYSLIDFIIKINYYVQFCIKIRFFRYYLLKILYLTSSMNARNFFNK